MTLKEFITKNKAQALTEVRCGSCGNSLSNCGKYTIETVGMGKGKSSEEGIICETCQKHSRKLNAVTKIMGDKAQTVTNFSIANIDPSIRKQTAELLEEEKAIETDSIKAQKESAEEVKDNLTRANNNKESNKKDNKEDK